MEKVNNEPDNVSIFDTVEKLSRQRQDLIDALGSKLDDNSITDNDYKKIEYINQQLLSAQAEMYDLRAINANP